MQRCLDTLVHIVRSELSSRGTSHLMESCKGSPRPWSNYSVMKITLHSSKLSKNFLIFTLENYKFFCFAFLDIHFFIILVIRAEFSSVS